MSIDLNNPLDFARVTLSPTAQLLQELGLDPAKWDLVEASFISNQTIQRNPKAKPVTFLVFESPLPYQAGLAAVNDTGGRRKVKYTFPYRDGGTTDDLGRKPESFSLELLFHGPKYKEGLKAFLAECNQPTPGVFRHPVRGEQTVVIDDYELTHRWSERFAVSVRVVFSEHTFTLDKLTERAPKGDSTLKTALVAALDGVKAINRVITKVESTLIASRQISNQITAALEGYKEGYFAALQRINKTFNNGTSSDLPTLLPVNEGGVSSADGTVEVDSFPVVKAPNDPFIGFPVPEDETQVPAVATVQAIDSVNELRADVSEIIDEMSEVEDGQGALIFYSDILELKRTAILMQEALETGITSSQAQVVDFTTPRLMSVREVAFAVGLPVDQSYQIELLNPSLLSNNFIEAGTLLQVPVAT